MSRPLRINSRKPSVCIRSWLHEAEPLYQDRRQQLEAQRRSANAEAETRYQQRMAEIAAAHQRAMEAITQRYQQA